MRCRECGAGGGMRRERETTREVLVVAHDCDTRWVLVSPGFWTVVDAAATAAAANRKDNNNDDKRGR